MELTILDHKLQILRVTRDKASILTYPILKLLLVHSNCKCDFLCVTVTPDDITLVLDEVGQKELPKHDDITSQESVWVALHATCALSSSTAGLNKLINSVIVPLADNGITVFNISTFQDDLILIREDDLDKAIRSLSDDVIVVKENEKTTSPKMQSDKNEEKISNTSHCSTRTIKHPIQSPSNRFLITSMHLDELRHVTAPLIELMFFSESFRCSNEDDRIEFFSFSIIHDHISFVLDAEMYNRFPPGYLYCSQNDEGWKMLKIGFSDLGFDEAGIVAQMSEPLSHTDMPIYYISTFLHDHLLVSEMHIQTVLKILQDKRLSQAYDAIEGAI